MEKHIKNLDEIEWALKYDEQIITNEEAGRRIGLMIGVIIGMLGAVATCLYIYKKKNIDDD